MHLAAIDWFIIVIYLLVSLGIGLYYRKRASKSLADFFLGGRSFPWYIAGISMVATTFAADTPLAITELVAKNGISGNWLWWNMLIGGMLTTFFFARLWRRADVLTELEFIELRYSGRSAAVLRGFKAVYLGLFMNALIIGWVNLAMMSIFKVFTDIPDDQLIWYTAGTMFIAAGYSALSGLWGVAITDAIQFIIAMAGTIILAFIVLSSEKIGGISGLKAQLPEESLNFFPNILVNSAEDTGTALGIGLGSFLAFIAVQWWASWYPGNEPGGGGYVAQRMMSAKNEKHALYATLFFQIAHYCIRPWPWIIVGLCTLVLYPGLGPEEAKLGYVMAMKDFLPAGLKGLLLVAFLAAYMSTISTQLNWGASFLVNDLYKRFVLTEKGSEEEKKKLQKNYVLSGKIFTLIIMAIALFITSRITSISGVWEFLIEAGAGLGLVLILRWYWWRINAWSEIVATLAPFLAYGISHYYLDMQFPESFFLTVGFTTVAWLAITYATAPVRIEHLSSFYQRVKPDGAWGPFRLESKEIQQKSNLFNLSICWISSIVMTYSLLFLTGKIIFQEWSNALFWLAIAAVSGIIFKIFVIKTKVIGD